jgi:hypothetical protein
MNANLKPFRSGAEWTGNRKGRPPIGAAIAEMARDVITRRGLVEKLGSIASRKGSLQVRAIEVLFAYAYGKPPSEIRLAPSGQALDVRAVLIQIVQDCPEEMRGFLAHRLIELGRAEAGGSEGSLMP